MCDQAENSSIQLFLFLVFATSVLFSPLSFANQAQIEKVGEAFEGLMVQRMLTQMRESNSIIADSDDNPFKPSHAEKIYRSMLDQELAKSLARQNPFGIKEIVVRQLSGKSGIANRQLVE